MKQLNYVYTTLICFLFASVLSAQKVDNAMIRYRIEEYKKDIRGPYKDIRWFCKDGSVIPPKEKCPETGGVQRARYKDEVDALGRTNHIFLGQILSTTSFTDFWDAENFNSRLKQYQLEKYLRSVDDGWILRKGQFYRGAYQIEDEEAWGIDFFTWLLSRDDPLEEQFFLIRQAAKDIPHRGEDSKSLEVRSLSKVISDEYPPFMDLRVKIHGQPERGDIARVRAFRELHRGKLSLALLQKFETLISTMEEVYRPVDLQLLNRFVKNVPRDSKIGASLTAYIEDFSAPSAGPSRVMATAEKLAEIREEILSVKSRRARLALLDLSNALEEIFFREIAEWEARTVKSTMDKLCYTGLAAMGTGFIEMWEWEELLASLAVPRSETVTLNELTHFLERSRALVEWGTGMVRAVYKDAVNLYSGFEPLASGFFDDRVRSSVLLNLGQTLGQLNDFIAKEARLSNQVLDISNQGQIRGLNPGLAMGELVVVESNEEDVEVASDKIYVFHSPPADLKPVAGIATVTEGNLVSHVQLLARNLGIPNIVLSSQNLEDLKRFSGRKVFFAVSNKGTVLMKLEKELTREEEQLFAVKQRSEEKITVPVGKIDLEQTGILNMRQVNATHSGRLCGPKAANLGQLKAMFPDNVVEGIVLPFGLFRAHMDQPMPGRGQSYWQFLNNVFAIAGEMRKDRKPEAEIESYVLNNLETLREAIKKIDLLPSFVRDLEDGFRQIFGKPIGEVPIFVRSDTNMEDLKDFTGAGLNLTLFNVVDKARVMQGIKEVWASPYTERSFKWRQRYLLNPENVFPSILIIPSVDVEYSGVLITKGITSGDGRDLTIAFSRGAGGAVDGQAAESYLLHHSGIDLLLSPAREPTYRRLPESGGTITKWATFEEQILSDRNRYDLRVLAYEVHQKLPDAPGIETEGPFDVELGFKEDKIWLFQVRPFVENKSALSSGYLQSITPRIDGDKKIKLMTKI